MTMLIARGFGVKHRGTRLVVDGTLFFKPDDGKAGRELGMIKPLGGSQDWQRYD